MVLRSSSQPPSVKKDQVGNGEIIKKEEPGIEIIDGVVMKIETSLVKEEEKSVKISEGLEKLNKWY